MGKYVNKTKKTTRFRQLNCIINKKGKYFYRVKIIKLKIGYTRNQESVVESRFSTHSNSNRFNIGQVNPLSDQCWVKLIFENPG